MVNTLTYCSSNIDMVNLWIYVMQHIRSRYIINNPLRALITAIILFQPFSVAIHIMNVRPVFTHWDLRMAC